MELQLVIALCIAAITFEAAHHALRIRRMRRFLELVGGELRDVSWFPRPSIRFVVDSGPVRIHGLTTGWHDEDAGFDPRSSATTQLKMRCASTAAGRMQLHVRAGGDWTVDGDLDLSQQAIARLARASEAVRRGRVRVVAADGMLDLYVPYQPPHDARATELVDAAQHVAESVGRP